MYRWLLLFWRDVGNGFSLALGFSFVSISVLDGEIELLFVLVVGGTGRWDAVKCDQVPLYSVL